MRAPEPAVTAGILAPVLGLNPAELEARLAAAARQRRGFLWVKRRVSFAQESQRLRGLRLAWIELRPESLRAYPKGPLAAHILGSVDLEEHGNGGIEQSLEKDLRGRPGVARVIRDVVRRGVDSRIDVPAVPGKNLTLTIDERIQMSPSGNWPRQSRRAEARPEAWWPWIPRRATSWLWPVILRMTRTSPTSNEELERSAPTTPFRCPLSQAPSSRSLPSPRRWSRPVSLRKR